MTRISDNRGETQLAEELKCGVANSLHRLADFGSDFSDWRVFFRSKVRDMWHKVKRNVERRPAK